MVPLVVVKFAEVALWPVECILSWLLTLSHLWLFWHWHFVTIFCLTQNTRKGLVLGFYEGEKDGEVSLTQAAQKFQDEKSQNLVQLLNLWDLYLLTMFLRLMVFFSEQLLFNDKLRPFYNFLLLWVFLIPIS